MRIGIDARFFGPLGKGLGRYTQRLIEQLELLDQENTYYIFLRRENFDLYQPQNPNFQKVLADYRWYTFAEQWGWPRLLKKYHLDLVHFPHFNVPLLYRGKFVLTIHDLILLRFPTLRATKLNAFFYAGKFLAYRLVINLAALRAQKIITVSAFTKQDILAHFPLVKPAKIVVTHEGVREACVWQARPAEILQKYAIMKPYLLYLGNAYPHKNLERLVAAFAQLKSEFPELHLVLAGGQDYFWQRLKNETEAQKITQVIFPGQIAEVDLDALYRQAWAFVFPSLFEGFGLPPLEAMAVGTPVLAAAATCLPEILGQAVVYTEAETAEDLAAGLRKILQLEESEIEKMRAAGYKQVAKYAWREMAAQTHKIYSEINN